MRLLLIDTTLAGLLVNALCNTLIYSLLQGVLLAAITGLIVICTRKQTAVLRYNLLVSALFVFTAGVAATFIIQLANGIHTIQGAVLTQAPLQQSSEANISQPVTAIPTASFTYLLYYLNSHSNTIVLVWFLIICAKTIQLGIGLHGTYRLKRVDVYAVAGYWQERMQQISVQLGIRQGVTLLESGPAKVPMVIGHLKPVILVPLGLLANLTPGEVEAILMHELAHIRRRDFLVNLLQSLVEIIFFFNPAVLWLSQLIKTERENCCDDLALQQNNSKANYIRALLSCEQYRAVGAAHAMAFPGSRHGLLHRVKRVANNSNHSLNLLEKTLLAVCLVISISGICLSAFAKKQTTKQPVNKVVQTNKDSVHTKGKMPVAKKPEKFVEPKSTVHPHQTNQVVQPVSNTVAPKTQEDSTQPTPKALLIGQYKTASRDGWTQQQEPQYGYYARARMLNKQELASERNYMLTLAARRKAETRKYGWIEPPSPRNGYYSQAGAPQSMAVIDERRHVLTPAERQKMNDDMLHAITADMLHDGIITQTGDLDFKLTRDEFMVNGQQQDAAILKRYNDKYVPANDNSGWTWTHSQHAPHKE